MANLLNNSKSMEETNKILKQNNLPSYEDAITVSFRISKKKFFTVTFGDVKAYEQKPYFSTTASMFNHIRTDWKQCGQAQESILSKNTAVYKFFEKWDEKHCKNLELNELEELKLDLKKLKEQYPNIESNGFNDLVRFDRELSK